MSTILSNLKVLDFTHLLAGPFCTKVLGDFGADVVKIEKPETGDESRAYGPFVNGESMYYVDQNRNKKSVVLDLKSEEGHQAALALVRAADVLVENFRPDVMERLGLGYDTVKELNPKLIYASCSGYDPGTSMAGAAAGEGTIQAHSGIMGITGEPGQPLSKIGFPVVSTMSGLLLASGIFAALLEQKKSGRGQKIHVSLYDTALAIIENPLVRYCNAGIVTKPTGNSNAVACPFSSFTAKDGSIIIATTDDGPWTRLCNAMGHPELAQDPRFVTMDKRAANWVHDLQPLMNDILKEKNMSEWIEILRAHNVVCGTINTIEGLTRDPQVAARKLFREIAHPRAGTVQVISTAPKFSRTPSSIRRTAPILGEHTTQILSGLESVHDQLRKEGSN